MKDNNSNNYNTILILAAGIGSRLGSLIGYTHKALISVAGKPVINHIIDKFPIESEIVIAVGYEKDLLIEYLNFTYNNRNFKFVTIDKYVGKDSGPGYSLKCCKDLLQKPFLLTTCDTIVNEYPAYKSDINTNWIGVSECEDPKLYCTIESNVFDLVTDIYEKTTKGTNNAYIGIMNIVDYEMFWDSLCDNKDIVAEEIQVSNSWKFLINNNRLEVRHFDNWFDTGNVKSLQKTRELLGGTNNLEKEGENIYFVSHNNKKEVIKYFKDKNIIRGRVERSKILRGIVPEIKNYTDHFYNYEMIDGEIMSEIVTDNLFLTFLNWCKEKLWVPIELSDLEEKINFKNICKKLHESKTRERIKKLLDSKLIYDIPEKINGYEVPPVKELLNRINWNQINNEGIPVLCHGDLHFENVVCKENGKFILLDWRQEFGGQYKYGDLYYDLAKLYHGLLVNHKSVYNNMFSVKKTRSEVQIDIEIPYSVMSCQKVFENFLDKNPIADIGKVKILTYLVFLNIACLHESEYGKFLWYFGRLGLYKEFFT